MWIKICGNTSFEDAQMAVESGANALGFVFAASPRQVTEGQAGRIVSRLPAGVDTFGVFVDEDFDTILRAVKECGLTGVQLHGRSDKNFIAHLRETLAGISDRVKVVCVVRRRTEEGSRQDANGSESQAGSESDFDQELARCSRNPTVDAVLVDTWVAKARGGTGSSFDWESARTSLQKAAPGSRLIVAGGLRPANVRSAIALLRPWGVDVVSGVERAPGKKDPVLVQAFIRAVRDTETEFSASPVLLGVQ